MIAERLLRGFADCLEARKVDDDVDFMLSKDLLQSGLILRLAREFQNIIKWK
jgi:hypothetical protein